MYIGSVMKNEKEQKRHKIHQNAVFTELMAKNNMEGI